MPSIQCDCVGGRRALHGLSSLEEVIVKIVIIGFSSKHSKQTVY